MRFGCCVGGGGDTDGFEGEARLARLRLRFIPGKFALKWLRVMSHRWSFTGFYGMDLILPYIAVRLQVAYYDTGLDSSHEA